MKSIISKIVVVAVAAALTVTGLSLAQGNGGRGAGDGNGPQANEPDRGRPPGPPPFLQGMTNAEIQRQVDGDAVVTRLDAGKIKTIAADSITLTENDGADVTIPVDADTEAYKPGEPESSVTDLVVGQKVMVDRELGQAADSVHVMPKRPRHH